LDVIVRRKKASPERPWIIENAKCQLKNGRIYYLRDSIRFMNRVSCEKLNKFYEKYLIDNQKVDEIFFGELSNIKNKKYLTPLELIAILSWKIGYYLPIGRYIEAVSKKGFTEVKVCSETAFRLVDENRIDEALLKFANLLDINSSLGIIF
jgi:hypothetical protein